MLRRITNVAHPTRRLISTTAVENGQGASSLSLVLPGGSRFEQAPGVAHLLQRFAFQDTKTRSGLRLQRESELLGGQLTAELTREHLILTARFLREDLPYFVEALADTVSKPLFREYQFNEDVLPLAKLEAQKKRQNSAFQAVENAFEASFHTGLGNSTLVSTSAKLADVVEFANQVFTTENAKLFGRNVNAEDLKKFASSDFTQLFGQKKVNLSPTELFEGDFRVKNFSGDQAVVLAYPTKQSKGLNALEKVLSGRPVKWSQGYGLLNHLSLKHGVQIKANNSQFSDASLFYITLTGTNASALKAATLETNEVVKNLGNLSDEVAELALSAVKFDAAEREGTLQEFVLKTQEASKNDLKEAAKSLDKVVVSVVGDRELPYRSDL